MVFKETIATDNVDKTYQIVQLLEERKKKNVATEELWRGNVL